jgi:hypothetical protein
MQISDAMMVLKRGLLRKFNHRHAPGAKVIRLAVTSQNPYAAVWPQSMRLYIEVLDAWINTSL